MLAGRAEDRGDVGVGLRWQGNGQFAGYGWAVRTIIRDCTQVNDTGLDRCHQAVDPGEVPGATVVAAAEGPGRILGQAGSRGEKS